MLAAHDVRLQFGGRTLFDDVNLKFTPGNCYGIIGANGAGKSTFLKILSGEISPTSGKIEISPGERLAVLKQNHFAYEEEEVLRTVILGHAKLVEIMKEKDALYAKEDFSDADGERTAELEGLFAEMNGWEAEANAASLLAGLGIKEDLHSKKMKELTGGEKVKVLLAQALFGKPEILLLDEPTNDLDLKAIQWLENFIMDQQDTTVLVVSHDRHFLNKVCTHICDIDFSKIKLYVGNYDFWYKSSQLAQRMMSDQNKKVEEKMKELKEFIQRFSANASKSSQATSRKKMLDKLTLEDIQPSSRKYPYVGFRADREAGDQLLRVEGLTVSLEGEKIINNVSFTIKKGQKVVFLAKSEVVTSALFKVLMGELTPDAGKVEWGITTTRAYLPNDNSEFFKDSSLDLINWLRQYSKDQTETFLRGFLGRMLFSGEEALKKCNVLSGGEKVRCMLSKMMLSGSNVLVMDNPTNHLDLETITAVNEGLIDFKGTLLFTSHDHEFIQTIANRVISIEGKGVRDEECTYDHFLGLE
ncbi:ABC-F family ATP-binding cassette domain-containing protein [Peredibacter starrii]|uniref:Probable ATP-binding protein YbiT n=1 Tax=Peredibacter starrii TaxID=28202 RepID=A0AAX4HV20_9BACT|nr:ATP-binding cassette domain-containing protein [Peredibacter starrii]WPU67025.1 ATP-binding cassette domain-containing protein [Peredibacter starrii]